MERCVRRGIRWRRLQEEVVVAGYRRRLQQGSTIGGCGMKVLWVGGGIYRQESK